MEHLDDFLREQFQQDDPAERFPFREAYWEQALPLIEAAERKRRRVWWWWLTGLLVLGGGWWGWEMRHQLAASETQISIKPSPSTNNYSTVIHPEQEGAFPTETPGVAVSEVSVMAYEILRNREFYAASNYAEKNIPPAKSPKKQPDPAGNVELKRTLNEISPTKASLQKQEGVIHPAAGTNPKIAGQIVEKQLLNAEYFANTQQSERRPTVFACSRLPNSFRPLLSGGSGFTLAQVPYHFPTIQPVRQPVFAFGLNASATTYSAAPANHRWGLLLGTYGECWVLPAWSVSAGLAWRKQPIQTAGADSLTSSYQLHYRFGYEATSYRREDRALQFIEIPVAIHGHYRAWELEAGLAFGRLVQVQAVQIETNWSSLIPQPEKTETRIRGDRTSYRRQYTSLFAGIGWQALDGLQLEVRGTYRPAPLLRDGLEIQATSGGFWLDAGLRWQLFRDDRIRLKK